jgi:hypothetical protein
VATYSAAGGELGAVRGELGAVEEDDVAHLQPQRHRQRGQAQRAQRARALVQRFVYLK